MASVTATPLEIKEGGSVTITGNVADIPQGYITEIGYTPANPGGNTFTTTLGEDLVNVSHTFEIDNRGTYVPYFTYSIKNSPGSFTVNNAIQKIHVLPLVAGGPDPQPGPDPAPDPTPQPEPQPPPPPPPEPQPPPQPSPPPQPQPQPPPPPDPTGDPDSDI